MLFATCTCPHVCAHIHHPPSQQHPGVQAVCSLTHFISSPRGSPGQEPHSHWAVQFGEWPGAGGPLCSYHEWFFSLVLSRNLSLRDSCHGFPESSCPVSKYRLLRAARECGHFWNWLFRPEAQAAKCKGCQQWWPALREDMGPAGLCANCKRGEACPKGRGVVLQGELAPDSSFVILKRCPHYWSCSGPRACTTFIH